MIKMSKFMISVCVCVLNQLILNTSNLATWYALFIDPGTTTFSIILRDIPSTFNSASLIYACRSVSV